MHMASRRGRATIAGGITVNPHRGANAGGGDREREREREREDDRWVRLGDG
jgi:hypothetical protein